MTITYGSVCSGIEAATVAWRPLGWRAAWLAEIEPFPSAILAHHYPDTPNLGDMTTIADKVRSGEVASPDILTGGTPCQAFSVAGLRKGMNDERGQLSLEFCRLADAIDAVRIARGERPAAIIWENVPGVLSDKSNAFGCFLAALAGEDDPLLPPGGKWTNAGCVFGPQRTIAWRVLDAQYFGVAQRRRRVWVVASAGAIDPCQVLFESEGVRRDSAPSREAGEGTAGAAPGGAGISGGDLAGTLNAHYHKGPGSANFGEREVVAFHAEAQPDSLPGSGRDTSISDSLTRSQHAAVALQDDATPKVSIEVNGCLRRDAGGMGAVVMTHLLQVRRLTPVECERLQGFPDNYTTIPWRKKPAEDCPDGPRYKVLGNSWAVPCAAWIGNRINAAEQEQ